jgi:uncharacterized protein involved in outer membrane biogenesis
VLVKEVELNPFTLSLRVTGFEIREADQSALLGFDEFFVNLQASSLIRRAYVFDTIRLTVPYVSARVSKDGRMNLAELVPPDGGSQSAEPSQAEKASAEIPAIEIGEFEIAQGIVEFRDESKPKPYVLDIVPIHIVFKNFHTKPGGDNSYAFTAELGKGETFSWAGTVSLEPIQLVIPRSLLRGQSLQVPSGVWRARRTRQSERERTVRGKSTTILSFL